MRDVSSIDPNKLNRLRQQLDSETGPRYWRALEELAGDEGFSGFLVNEFPALEALWNAPVSRRDALKLMAASMAFAGMTGCQGQPPERLVPYVNMPEGEVPGQPRYYATAAVRGGYAQGLLAQSHQGRPVKVEGNPQHPATLGACDAISQASVLSLYDPDRSAAVINQGQVSGYGAFLAAVRDRQAEWDKTNGRGLALLTETVTSPSQHARIEALLRRWPQARWYTHEPVDRRAVLDGTELAFGEPLEPIYHFGRVKVAVSLDADFMQSQPGFLRYAREFMARRRPRQAGTDLARFYALESTPSITGTSADHRYRVRHDHVGDAARQLGRAMGLDVPEPDRAPLDQRWLDALVADLREAGKAAVVVPGDRQPAEVHAVAQALNAALGAVGETVEYIRPVAASHAAGPLSDLAEAMSNGQVQSLVMLGANPVYTAPADLAFEQALQQVPWRVHWGAYYNETARLAHWHIPATHALESWDDARAYDGTVSLIQPLIQPLHGGKTALQLLTALTDAADRDAHELLRSHWQGRHEGSTFAVFWRRSLRDGVIRDTSARPLQPQLRADWHGGLPGEDERSAAEDQGLRLQFQPDPAVWDGTHANNGWLQELPRPLTKLTWRNAVLIGPDLAKQHQLAEGDMVRLTTRAGAVEAPVYVLPGMPEGALTLNLGYGRRHSGRVSEGLGSNAFALRTHDAPWSIPVTLEPTGEHQPLAVTQSHHAMEERDLIRAANLDHYEAFPGFAQEPEPHESLYPEPSPTDQEARNAWGMSIDLSACIGCNACVTACQAENNIPIVGEQEVRRGREMHWIRIDRYFEGSPSAPRMTYQPVPCMHCENAPCEYVCPVAATQHSASGLNQMIYNRCVGTRYCSQNCPYKVRRFNWFNYTGEDAAYRSPPPVQNPEVSIRTRGVMEKCTYCVQRINRVRQTADIERRPIQDGELQTACQQACPTQAIVFGDLKDEDSEVSRLKADPLNYGILTHLNTRPRTTYMAAVTNRNPVLDDEPGTTPKTHHGGVRRFNPGSPYGGGSSA